MIKKYVAYFSFYDGEYNRNLIVFVHAISDDPDRVETIKKTVLESSTAKEYLEAGFYLDNMTVDEVPVDICPANSDTPIVVNPVGLFIRSDFMNSHKEFKDALLDLVSIYAEHTNL